jgi:hypothetical protein
VYESQGSWVPGRLLSYALLVESLQHFKTATCPKIDIFAVDYFEVPTLSHGNSAAS